MKRQRYYNHGCHCEQCGKVFQASRYDAKYCGDRCRKEASREPARYAAAKKRAEDAIHYWLGMQRSDRAYQHAVDDLISLLAANSLVED